MFGLVRFVVATLLCVSMCSCFLDSVGMELDEEESGRVSCLVNSTHRSECVKHGVYYNKRTKQHYYKCGSKYYVVVIGRGELREDCECLPIE